MHGAGAQAPRQVHVGQDQVGLVHPAQRGDAHPGIGHGGENTLVQEPPVMKDEGAGFRRDGEGVLELEVGRTVSPQSLVSFEGNFYSVPPGLNGAQVRVLQRLGEDYLHIVSAGRAVVARHRQAPRVSGQTRP
jgi:hypothetical protein